MDFKVEMITKTITVIQLCSMGRRDFTKSSGDNAQRINLLLESY